MLSYINANAIENKSHVIVDNIQWPIDLANMFFGKTQCAMHNVYICKYISSFTIDIFSMFAAFFSLALSLFLAVY